MPEKHAEKTLLESEKPITTGVLRFRIQGLLVLAGKKGMSVQEIITALEPECGTKSKSTIGKIIEEMTATLPPLMYVESFQRRTGRNKFPTNFFYITRYKK